MAEKPDWTAFMIPNPDEPIRRWIQYEAWIEELFDTTTAVFLGRLQTAIVYERAQTGSSWVTKSYQTWANFCGPKWSRWKVMECVTQLARLGIVRKQPDRQYRHPCTLTLDYDALIAYYRLRKSRCEKSHQYGEKSHQCGENPLTVLKTT
jgi:hypothetical protein